LFTQAPEYNAIAQQLPFRFIYLPHISVIVFPPAGGAEIAVKAADTFQAEQQYA
jgi:hypothetical protein